MSRIRYYRTGKPYAKPGESDSAVGLGVAMILTVVIVAIVIALILAARAAG